PHHTALHSFPTRRSSDLETIRTTPHIDRTLVPLKPQNGAAAPRCFSYAPLATISASSETARRTSSSVLKKCGPRRMPPSGSGRRSEEHTSELQSPYDLVC